MAEVKAKCTNCGAEIFVDDKKEAGICSSCAQAFVTEKAIRLYNQKTEQQGQLAPKKKRHAIKSLGKGLLLALECIGYLFYVLFFVWLFVDITNDFKKK